MHLLCHVRIECRLFCQRKQRAISYIKEKIFNAKGDAYLPHATSYASLSCSADNSPSLQIRVPVRNLPDYHKVYHFL